MLSKSRAEALVVQTDELYREQRERLVRVATAARIPVVGGMVELVDIGALFSYSPDRIAYYRRAASYADRILKGSKPAEMPVEQPTEFELILNMKTAKTLGIAVPQTVFMRAAKIIE